MRLGGPVWVILVAALLSGCSFNRTVVNSHVRDINTSWIKPGVTTRDEVVRRIGLPPTVKFMGGVRKDSFRWVTVDTRGKRFEAGYILTPTFELSNECFAHDIMVLFDKDGVVSLVSRTASDGENVTLLEWREATK